MKLSDTSKDFERVEEPTHVDRVLKELTLNVPKYFDAITELHKIENAVIPTNDKVVWTKLLTDGIAKFEKESLSYQKFFSEDNMEEFEEIDDAKVFKSELKKDCPIIRKSLMSSMTELQKWKEDFAMAKAQDLFETFANFLDFMRDYADATEDINYDDLETQEDFQPLFEFSNDEDLVLRNVIGAGIKTTIIYNIMPQLFCKSVRRTLYGLSFLTRDIHILMPSRTSEFIMMDDTDMNKGGRNAIANFRMEHNYWYPFNIFMLYTNHIYKTIEVLLNKMGITLEPKYRFVYVNLFLELICLKEMDAVRTMMGGDQDF
jgi:hypothetical protein